MVNSGDFIIMRVNIITVVQIVVGLYFYFTPQSKSLRK